MLRNLMLFGLVGGLTFSVAFWSLPIDWVLLTLSFAGYWIILATALCALFVAWWNRQSLRQFASACSPRQWAIAAAITLALLSLTAVHEKQQPKIYADEVLLVAASMNMHLERDARVPHQGYYFNDIYHASNPKLDKRPLLFPFALSLLHDLTGYRLGNALALNYLSAFALALAAFLIVSHWVPRPWPYAVIPLLFAPSLVHNSVASAGFEIFNMLWICLFMLACLLLVRRPTPSTLLLMVTCAVCLANVRYESILYSLAIPPVVLLAQRRNKHLLRAQFIPLLPLLYLLPLLFLRLHFSYEHFWQMESRGVTQPFSLSYIGKNLAEAIYFFFNINPFYGNSLILSVLGTLGAIIGLVSIRGYIQAHRTLQGSIAVALIFLVISTGHLLFLMAYHFGQFTDGIVARLSLPIMLQMTLIPFAALALARVNLLRPQIAKATLLILTLHTALFSPPNIAEGKANIEMIHSRDMDWAMRTIKANFDPERVLVVTHTGPTPLIHKLSSTTIENINRNPQLTFFYRDNHYFEEILIVETFNWDPYSDLHRYQVGSAPHADFETEVFAQTRMNPNVLTRIIRITGARDYQDYKAKNINQPSRTPAEIAKQFFEEIP